MKATKRPLIVCITDTEYRAIQEKFTLSDKRQAGSLILEDGYFGDRPATVCRISDMGTKGKDSLVHTLAEAIDVANPTFVVELGICFGVKDDIRIGDVGICHIASDYEYQKINPTGVQHRGRTVDADSTLYTALNNYGTTYSGDFSVHGVVFACGDKVVNDGPFREFVSMAVPEAKCADMESYAFGQVCQNKKIPWIVIKASSDDGVNKGDEFQARAARNCANFFYDFINSDADLSQYFHIEYEVNSPGKLIDYIALSEDIFGRNPKKIEDSETSRTSYAIHYHPDIDWVIVYIDRAHSIPGALRAIAKQSTTPPHRIEVCVVSRQNISAQQKENYERILKLAGCGAAYVSTIKNFIFDRIVKQRFPSSTPSELSGYIDQRVHRRGAKPTSGKLYARSFLGHESNENITARPICVILGQGGVGKTTFCNSIVKLMNGVSDSPQHLMLVTKSDIMKNYSGNSINTISDLYREYARSSESIGRLIGENSFELALSCGSIVMVIDGIDEIESACGERFDMSSFVESIATLNGSLQSCRVILTSRDVGADRFEALSNADVVVLKGFDSDDVAEYLTRIPSEGQKELRKFIPKIQGISQFINPYLLNVAHRFLLSSTGSEHLFLSSELLNLDDPFEYVLARALQREIEKQTKGLTIDDYYEFLSYVVVDCSNSVTLGDFEEYIRTILTRGRVVEGDAVSNPYLKFFLFEKSNGRVKVSHEEFVAQILLNRAIHIFMNEGALGVQDIIQLENIFGESDNDAFGIVQRLNEKLRGTSSNHDHVNKKIKSAIDSIKSDSSMARAIKRQRAVYALHIFAFSYNGARGIDECRQVMDMIHYPGKIDRLYVLGDFPQVDYSGCTVTNSEFRNFGGFLLSRFDSKTSFQSCRFTNCSARYKKSGIPLGIFDKTCQFDDAMKAVLASSEEKVSDVAFRVKSDVKQILKAMRHGLGFAPMSENKIKMQTNLASERGYETFLGLLCKSGLIEYDKALGLYALAKSAESDAAVLCDEDYVQGHVLAAIAFIGKS
ncbi:NACHT domain-containing protein [Burkholderia ubonensis]|uniref:phosphorylase family protein n=1 Tax=Burkholderia ubonensis TaxID=101571 RepID=UPI0009B3AEC2|nr:NACHT domain-containing protein [Burkholderia ubonensis]